MSNGVLFIVELLVRSMSSQSQMQHRSIELPDELLSPQSKLVYLYLTGASAASVDEMQTALGLKKLTLYSVLRSLTADGFVHQNANKYTVVDE